MSEAHKPRFELVSIDGGAGDDETAAVIAAIDRMLEQERRAASSSLWLRAGRAQGRRLGMFDYRDRFSADDVWRLSVRLPFGGREYPGLLGRGDAR